MSCWGVSNLNRGLDVLKLRPQSRKLGETRILHTPKSHRWSAWQQNPAALLYCTGAELCSAARSVGICLPITLLTAVAYGAELFCTFLDTTGMNKCVRHCTWAQLEQVYKTRPPFALQQKCHKILFTCAPSMILTTASKSGRGICYLLFV